MKTVKTVPYLSNENEAKLDESDHTNQTNKI